MTVSDERVAVPVPVEIKNWAEPVKPPFVKKSTIRTYIIDPAAVLPNRAFTQISDYEPNRIRMAVWVIDAAVALVTAQPVASPDTSTATAAPQGGYLAPNTTGIPSEFFGPDAFWLNALTTVTRVVVLKEYS